MVINPKISRDLQIQYCYNYIRRKCTNHWLLMTYLGTPGYYVYKHYIYINII